MFESRGFEVFNCNLQSGLTAFEFIGYEEAIRLACEEFGDVDVENERTAGLYDKPKPRGDANADGAKPQAASGARPRVAALNEG